MKKIAIFYCFSLLFLLSASHLMIFQTTGKGETVRDITTTAITADTFVTKWDTTKSGVSLSTQIKLPLESTGTYNFVVDWGDGTTDTITTWDQAQTTHTYSTGGIKDVTFNGILRGWRFNNAGDVSKITGISQWGNMNLGNSGAYFMGASNMVLSATDAPDLTGTTSLYQAFRWCELLGNTGNMNNWDVSAVTDMGWMFLYAMSFNQPLGNWNVSSVTNMANMFMNAFYFNQPIGSWNTSSVTTMSNMFNSATAFNQSVGDWDVSKVTNMNNMFGGATNFNQPLNNWDVSNVIVMNNLLAGTSFNQPLDNWEVSSVTNMQGMFSGLTLFNHSLVNWNVSSVTVMNYMFFGASSFNQPIGDWNTSRVTSMSSMFENAFAFNQPIGSWDVSKVNQMRMMFSGVTSFNQPLDNWNVSSVTNMQGLFKGASLFNQSLGNWNVSKVFTMRDMFSGATSFNQPIGNWNVSSVTTMTGMFSGVTLGVSNYDDLLEGWSKLNLQNNVIFDAGFSRFTNNTAKQYIIDTFSWTITDGGYNDVTPPVISSPEDIFYVVGSIGNQISWNLDDINPNIYNVTHNGGLFTTSTAWTNGAVNVDIDGLSGGIHVFTIFVYDLDFNMATDTVYVTVKSEFITADLSSPSDLTYEFHSFGNQIIWSVGDDNPGVYNITLDGTIFSSTTSWSNGTISINVDGLTVGVHEFIIYVYDLEYNLVTDSVFVTVYKELNMPDLSTPADIIYQYESTGNQIQWTVGDINPSVYNITINGEILRPTTNWINGTITVSVDGLDIGSYTIIIFVYDLNGNRATDTVLVTVFSETTPPEISSPDDITYVFDSIENVIVWNVGDAHPGLYNMSVNGNLFMTNVEWNNGTIPLNVDGLDVGTHIFVISVCDTYFNCVQDTVVVTVTAVEDTSSSIPPTVIFSVVGVVVVAIGYFVYRKRKSG